MTPTLHDLKLDRRAKYLHEHGLVDAPYNRRHWERRPLSIAASQYQGREYVRFLVRERDHFTCQDCRLVRTPEMAKQLGVRQFDVHHLNGLCGKLSRKYDKASTMAGLITLCHKCHFNSHDHSSKLDKKLSTPPSAK